MKGKKSEGQDLCDPLALGPEKDGELQQVVYCKAKDGSGGGMDLEEMKEKEVKLWPTCSLARVPYPRSYE